MIRSLLAALVLFAPPASAQSVEACGWRTDMRFIAEPWEDNTRTFANGAVRLVRIDTWEPAAMPFQIVVISPPYGEMGWPQCRAIGAFAGVDFAALDARYDPADGLRFTVPVDQWIEDTVTRPRLLRFTLNQSTGAVTAAFDN